MKNKVILSAEDILKPRNQFEVIRLCTEPVIKSKIQKNYEINPGELDVLLEYVYEKIWQALYAFEKEKATHVMSWILTVADHAVIDYIRKYKFAEQPLHSEEILVDKSTRPDIQYEREEVTNKICKALSYISSSKRREILILSVFSDHMSYDNIAKIMKLSSAEAARQEKYHALKEMRQIFKKLKYDRDILKGLYT